MSDLCVCESTLPNGSQPNCATIIGLQKKFIFVPLFDSTGARNSIDLSATLNAAYFTAKINHVDYSKRWYVLPEMKNVTSEIGDPTFEEFDDKTKRFVRAGVRTALGSVINGIPSLEGAINSFRCHRVGVFIIDINGSIIGTISEDETLLDPKEIESQSINAKLVLASGDVSQKVDIAFQFSLNDADSSIRVLKQTDLTGVTPLTFTGLLTVKSTYSAIGLSSFKAKLFVENGSALTKFPVKGLLAGDFALYNVTDSLAVVIISATENPDGTYTITYAAQGATEVLRLTPTKTGYDFAAVVASTITLP